MSAIANIILHDARPDNQVHLLLWDTPCETHLESMASYNTTRSAVINAKIYEGESIGMILLISCN